MEAYPGRSTRVGIDFARKCLGWRWEKEKAEKSSGLSLKQIGLEVYLWLGQ